MFYKIFSTLALLASTVSFAAASDLPNKKTPLSPTSIGTHSRVESRAPSLKPVPATAWSGPYLGLATGYAFDGRSKVTQGDEVTLGGNRGVLASAQLGYDSAFQQSVIGLATDFSLATTKRTHHWDTVITASVPVAMTMRARLGYAFDEKILTYLTGGLASTQQTIHAVTSSANKSQTQMLLGNVFGVGAEYRISPHITSFIEFRHYRYLKEHYADFEAAHLDYAQKEFRLGVNYRY